MASGGFSTVQRERLSRCLKFARLEPNQSSISTPPLRTGVSRCHEYAGLTPPGCSGLLVIIELAWSAVLLTSDGKAGVGILIMDDHIIA